MVMVILLAGLQVIPKDYAEAAEVFGATAWQRLRYVTLPLLRPSLQVALIMRTILAFQVFAVVIALAGRNLPGAGRRGLQLVRRQPQPDVAAGLRAADHAVLAGQHRHLSARAARAATSR